MMMMMMMMIHSFIHSFILSTKMRSAQGIFLRDVYGYKKCKTCL